MASPAPKWRRRIGAMLFGCAVLALAEAALRLLGIASPDVPVRELFYHPSPVFVRDGAVYRTSEKAQKYFLNQSFPAVKLPGALRVFIAGGSVAMGFPLESIYGPTQLLQVGLDTLDPGRTHEVINVGGFGYNSHRVAQVVAEIVHYRPDVIIVMTGHNEYLEERFYHEAGPAAPFYGFRLYRLFAGLVSAARDEGDDVQWEAHVVNDRERMMVLADYTRNLESIVETCAENGVKLILVTCPANIQDFRPYGPSLVPLEAQEKIDRELKQGGDHLDQAMDLLKPFEKKHPDDAWVLFEEASVLRARALERSVRGGAQENGALPAGLDKTARKQLAGADIIFLRACYFDPWPVRASFDINGAIRNRKPQGVTVADADEYFSLLEQNSGYRDSDSFFDHCHLKGSGQEALVRSLLPALGQAGVVTLPAGWADVMNSAIEQLRASVPDSAWSQGIYAIGYESGVNMDRPARGLVYADLALKLDPQNVKAKMLQKRLEPLARSRYELTGE